MKRTKKTKARLKKGERILGLTRDRDRQNQSIPGHIVTRGLKRKSSANRKKR
ncbi:MAG: hypothetical protein GY810_15650 [Aureispira sp.]|nr:hypothetical protein [Aureispira sp.]